VRGHTSLRPAEEFSTYPDNWALAHERSRNVAKFLVNDLRIRKARIRISSAGESEPLHIGTDPVKLRQNPRVEVFLTNEVISHRTGTEEERQDRIFEE
jgi:chemotaxis protein MotB